MRIWIDTEFNSFQGDLISLGMIAEDGNYLYVVRKDIENMNIDPWVAEFVMPHLYTAPGGEDVEPVSDMILRERLQRYLNRYEEVEIIADWPDDIRHLCGVLITKPGWMINLPTAFRFTLNRSLSGVSQIPHNALYDAIGNMQQTLTEELEVK